VRLPTGPQKSRLLILLQLCLSNSGGTTGVGMFALLDN